jgi:Tol biopolymer transport system component
MDANHGKPIGEQKVLREDIAPIRRSGISGDGRLLVFPLYTFGTGAVWLKDLVTGRERQLVATPPTPLNPVISPSGRWVAYTVSTIDEAGNAGRGAGYVIATTSGTPRKVCDDCEIYQWTADDSGVLLLEGRPVERAFTLLNLASGQRAVVLTAPEGIRIDRPMLSPTARWVSFSSADVLKVAEFRPGTNTAAEATSIRTLHGAERGAGWSPDGRMLYVLLETDGFRCLYSLAIDPATGHAVGDPSPVYHFHDASRTWGSTGFGNAVVPGMFLSNHFGYTGNIWMALLKP